jgi:hypothetical protein
LWVVFKDVSGPEVVGLRSDAGRQGLTPNARRLL